MVGVEAQGTTKPLEIGFHEAFLQLYPKHKDLCKPSGSII